MSRQVLWLVSLCAVTCAVDASTGPQVSTQSGDISGTVLKSFLGKNFFSFRGIPYAEPPVGDLRFRPPQPHQGWSGVRQALDFGNQCLQFALFSSPRQLQGSEDCLFVNVYTPQLPDSEQHPELPVMVFIHGGGFTTGSGDSDVYGPDYLMDGDVVLVTFNYRLGPMGFFTTEDAIAPGNYGLHDQVLALEWVQANIAAFGGDPDAVTIFGESAGGAAVGLQVLSPRSRGLFAKAISQSGASFCNFAASGEPQEEDAKRHAQSMECATSDSRKMVSCMRQKPGAEIFDSLRAILEEDTIALGDMYYKPRVDTESRAPFLPMDPFAALQSGTFNLVPWMTGVNSDEGSLFVCLLELKQRSMEACRGRNWTEWVSLLSIDKATSNPAALAETLHQRYFGGADCGDDKLAEYSDLLSDRWFTNCVLAEANLAATHTPMYFYVLDHTGPGRLSFTSTVAGMHGKSDSCKDFGVGHADDILYLFRPAFANPMTVDSDEYKMIRFMVSLWTNFARQGYPSTTEVKMPSWPIYSRSRPEYMRLNREPSVGRAPFSDRLQYWRELDVQENWRRPLKTNSHDEL